MATHNAVNHKEETMNKTFAPPQRTLDHLGERELLFVLAAIERMAVNLRPAGTILPPEAIARLNNWGR
jgi:hypothetical protein